MKIKKEQIQSLFQEFIYEITEVNKNVSHYDGVKDGEDMKAYQMLNFPVFMFSYLDPPFIVKF